MDQQQYLQERIDDQITWYNRKSKKNQRSYKMLRVLSILIALSIPLMTVWLGEGHDKLLKVLIGGAGALAAFLEAMQTLYRYHENWIKYRSTGEALLYLKYLFMTGSAPYSDPQTAFGMFVQNAEALMAQERAGWGQAQAAKTEETSKSSE